MAAVKGKKQRCWLFRLSHAPNHVSEKELEAAFRSRYTTVLTVGFAGDQAASAISADAAAVIVRVLFKGPQPSEGPAGLLRDLYGTQNVEPIPVELPRGRRSKRARTASEHDAARAADRGSGDHTSDSELSEYEEASPGGGGGGRSGFGERAFATGAEMLEEESKEEDPGDDGGAYRSSYRNYSSRSIYGGPAAAGVAAAAAAVAPRTGYGEGRMDGFVPAASLGATQSFDGGEIRQPTLGRDNCSLDMNVLGLIIKEELGETLSNSSNSPQTSSPRRARRWGQNGSSRGFPNRDDPAAMSPPPPVFPQLDRDTVTAAITAAANSTSTPVAAAAAAAAAAPSGAVRSSAADAAGGSSRYGERYGNGYGPVRLPSPEQPPRTRCEPRVCSFSGLPARDGASSIHFQGAPRMLASISGRSLLVRFAVDNEHFTTRHSAAVRVTADGRAFAALEYPSMEDIWPDLWTSQNVRMVTVDLEVHLGPEVDPDGRGSLIGPELTVTYSRRFEGAASEDAALTALDTLQLHGGAAGAGGSGSWGRVGFGARPSVPGTGGSGRIVDDDAPSDASCLYTCNDLILDWCGNLGNFFTCNHGYHSVHEDDEIT